MSTAVLVHELYKKFTMPGLQIWGRTSRLSLKTSGYANAGYPALVVVAVDHVSFSVQEAEIFGVLGASDSGKTTLVRLLATLLQPDGGELRIFGQDALRQPRQVQRLVNRVSVEASFFKKLSSLENLLYGARQYGFSGSEIRRHAEDLLVRLGLSPAEIYQPLEALSARLPTEGDDCERVISPAAPVAAGRADPRPGPADPGRSVAGVARAARGAWHDHPDHY